MNELSGLSGAHVYRGSWRRDFDSTSYANASNVEATSQSPKALHGYVYPSLTNPAAQPSVTVLIHQDNTNTNTTDIWDATAGVVRATHGMSTQPAIFQNINGRCFTGDGFAEALVLDDRTPAIHAQKNQNLGIGTPQQPMGLATTAFDANVVPDGAAYIYNGSKYINHPDPNSMLGTILAADLSVTCSIIDAGMTTMYNGGAPMGVAAAFANATSSNTTPFATPGTGISITSGTSVVTLVGGAWPAGFQYAGLSINFNGFSYVILATGNGANTIFDIDGNGSVAPNTTAYILGVYDGPTLTNVPYTITGCQLWLVGNPLSTLAIVNTNSAATPPGFAFGYSQATNANLVQVKVRVKTAANFFRNLGNISLGPTGGGGLAGVTTGPTYAYAWYDTETGHMSNISPLYQVPKPTALGANGWGDFSNTTPFFPIDPGSISYPDQPTDGIRFSHIVFFRTLSTPGSSTLYPIGSLNPFVGKVHPGSASTRGSWGSSMYHGWMGAPNNYLAEPLLAPNTGPNYWYDFSSDSDLILTGGFRAPQFTNSKPMVSLRGGATQPGYPYLMAYWDRRLWIVNTQEPDKLAFSCDDAQCPLGIPEESFPPTNFLRMTSVDARGMGLRTVGDMLLLTTERWAYIVAGNNESNYRLMKVSAAMPGVGTYQMDEFPTYSGAEGEPATLFYLGRDRVVYQWTVGGQVVPISQPIQSSLDTALSKGDSSLVYYQSSRVHCVSAWGRRLVVVQLPLGGAMSIWDIDNRVWCTTSATDDSGAVNTNFPAPMTSVYGLNVPVNELYAIFNGTNGNVVVRSWVRDDVATCTDSMSISTFPLSFDGKKTRKQVVAVNLHATAGSYKLQAEPNESLTLITPQSTFAAYPDSLDSIYGANPQPYEGSGVQDSVVMAGQFYSDGTPLVGYRFRFFINRFDTSPCRIFAIDIGYIDMETPGEGDP